MAKDNYTCEGKLEQITPMIHFQAETPGACLRASEVKPKLDRFLIEQYGKKIPKEWQIPTDKKNEKRVALRYKLSFRADGAVKKQVSNYIHKNYFAKGLKNNGDNKIKKTIFLKGGIDFKILCFEPTLLAEIKKQIRLFFLLHNFGTRQNKGFGSFRCKSNPEEKDINILKAHLKEACYYIDYKENKLSCSQKEQLDDILIISQLMKSGYNREECYYKGFIFKYFMENETRNDKAFMKMLLDYTELPKDRMFQRAMLGIQNSYNFKRKDKKGKKWNGSIELKKDVEGVERFNNPILFKPIPDYLVIIPQKIPEKMLGRVFKFNIKAGSSVEDQGRIINNKEYATYTEEDMKISTCSEFDLNDFLREFINYFNNPITIQSTKGSDFKRIKMLTIKGGTQ